VTALLVVSADDLGLTDGVCRAVLQAHLAGIVTSASLLAVGRSFDLAVRMIRDHPSLDVGAHLAIVGEDPPLLTAREVPSLVDRRGAFPLSYRTVVLRGLAGRLDPSDVRAEFGAQLERIRSAGVAVSHLDTHQHTHLWPAVARVLVELAAGGRIRAVRTPRSGRLLPVGFGVNLLAGRLRSTLRGAGLVTTDDYAGLDEAGKLDQARFVSALNDRGETKGTVEINSHPGLPGDPELGRFAWGYRWADELAMLTSPETRSAVASRGFRLGNFRDLVTTA
jgi:predicted glycoside hydrolase/deacetylase ChbG (UPF0249 family)